jgi:hypothetical protein
LFALSVNHPAQVNDSAVMFSLSTSAQALPSSPQLPPQRIVSVLGFLVRNRTQAAWLAADSFTLGSAGVQLGM